jgi:hypothetical protein
MPTDPYVTVTLKKDIVKKLTTVRPDQSTSSLVTEAIHDYIQNKSVKADKKTETITYFYVDGTTLNYQ